MGKAKSVVWIFMVDFSGGICGDGRRGKHHFCQHEKEYGDCHRVSVQPQSKGQDRTDPGVYRADGGGLCGRNLKQTENNLISGKRQISTEIVITV